jgi:hypothetical protein
MLRATIHRRQFEIKGWIMDKWSALVLVSCALAIPIMAIGIEACSNNGQSELEKRVDDMEQRIISLENTYFKIEK